MYGVITSLRSMGLITRCCKHKGFSNHASASLSKLVSPSYLPNFVRSASFSNKTADIHFTDNLSDDMPVKLEQFESLIKSPKDRVKIEEIINEYHLTKRHGGSVPVKLFEDNVRILLTQTTRERRYYFRYLYDKECARVRRNYKPSEFFTRKERALAKKYEKMNAERIGMFNNEDELVYGLWHNTPFTRIRLGTLRHKKRLNLFRAVSHGQNMVIDLTFCDYLNAACLQDLASQLRKLYLMNKEAANPYYLHLCNLNLQSELWKILPAFIKKIETQKAYINVTSKSYRDIFPQKNIVYISQHANEELNDYDHDAVLVICGMEENISKHEIFPLKNREEGVTVKRIPSLNYSLAENNVFKLDEKFIILNTMQENNNWEKAISLNFSKEMTYGKFEIEHDDVLVLRRISQIRALRANEGHLQTLS